MPLLPIAWLATSTTAHAFETNREPRVRAADHDRSSDLPRPVHGDNAISARLVAMLHWDPSGFRDPRFRFALETGTAAGDYN